MSSESVYRVASSWVDVGSFHTRLFGVVYFAIALVREFLDYPLIGLKARLKQRKNLKHQSMGH
jgi:hypothetical protein